jgi:hypothetical protein
MKILEWVSEIKEKVVDFIDGIIDWFDDLF